MIYKLKNFIRYNIEMVIPSFSISVFDVNRLSTLRSILFAPISFIAVQSSVDAFTVRWNLKFIDMNERRKHKRAEISAGIAFVSRSVRLTSLSNLTAYCVSRRMTESRLLENTTEPFVFS